jgi:hypothetical protein
MRTKGENKNLTHECKETEVKRDCAGEGQQQFQRPTEASLSLAKSIKTFDVKAK